MLLIGMQCSKKVSKSTVLHFRNFIRMQVRRKVIVVIKIGTVQVERMGMGYKQRKGTISIIGTLEIGGRTKPRPFYWNSL